MKITQEDLERLIEKVDFIKHGETLTICVLTLKGGFMVVDKSACISPEMYDQKIGENIAYNNAFNQLWQLEAYAAKRGT